MPCLHSGLRGSNIATGCRVLPQAWFICISDYISFEKRNLQIPRRPDLCHNESRSRAGCLAIQRATVQEPEDTSVLLLSHPAVLIGPQCDRWRIGWATIFISLANKTGAMIRVQ